MTTQTHDDINQIDTAGLPVIYSLNGHCSGPGYGVVLQLPDGRLLAGRRPDTGGLVERAAFPGNSKRAAMDHAVRCTYRAR